MKTRSTLVIAAIALTAFQASASNVDAFVAGVLAPQFAIAVTAGMPGAEGFAGDAADQFVMSSLAPHPAPLMLAMSEIVVIADFASDAFVAQVLNPGN